MIFLPGGLSVNLFFKGPCITRMQLKNLKYITKSYKPTLKIMHSILYLHIYKIVFYVESSAVKNTFKFFNTYATFFRFI